MAAPLNAQAYCTRVFVCHIENPNEAGPAAPVSESNVMAAVRPTPEDPRPVVETASGATFMTARSSWLLATPGSPTMRQLMSPRRCVPLARLRSLRDLTSLSVLLKCLA